MQRYCASAKNVNAVFRKPTSFTLGWDTTNVRYYARSKLTRTPKNGGIYLANCPKGFVALGSVAAYGTEGTTPTSANFPGFRCIASQFAEKSSYGETIW